MIQNTTYGLVKRWATDSPEAPALLAPGREPMDYAGLADQIDRISGTLGEHGIGTGDRVAIVMENGPESAAAFLGVSAVATACPMNPSLRTAEYGACFDDLQPCALLVESGTKSPVFSVARERGIRIHQVEADESMPAGQFNIASAVKPEKPIPFAGPHDVALLLHTSGTTARPKQVPLTHANLAACVRAIINTLRLEPSDRCLNVMPFFHVHGLIGAMLCTLGSGGSVICTGGLDTARFFNWLEQLNPTWYTCAPSMHQSICQRAKVNNGPIRHTLRFARSAAAALAPSIAESLEAIFGVPVIEAYGMSEASQQICSNPLPPENRKPGSVGLPAGPEVAVLDEEGQFHTREAAGEVVIRGASVFSGYRDNPQANAESFIDGWLRTGDLGHFDSDGYLYLDGRSKEMINRGGENISPREIDEVLLRHEGIADAVTFGVADIHYGEEVAAIVVLQDGYSLTKSEIISHLAGYLADFKVPRHVYLTDAIPKSSTGKPQRHRLAKIYDPAKAHANECAATTTPTSAEEKAIQAIWRELLDVEAVPLNCSFLELGGNSLFATRLISRLNQQFGTRLTLLDVFQYPTVADLARMVTA